MVLIHNNNYILLINAAFEKKYLQYYFWICFASNISSITHITHTTDLTSCFFYISTEDKFVFFPILLRISSKFKAGVQHFFADLMSRACSLQPEPADALFARRAHK